MALRVAKRDPAVAVAPATPSLQGASAISAHHLDYWIGSRRLRGGLQILDDVSLQVGKDEFVAIVGTSGCGKSTLLNLISGLANPTSGEIKVFGEPVSGVDPRIGYMFQTDALLPWRTVLHNVEVGLELAGVPKEERRKAARQQLAELGLAGFEEHYPAELSGGMRQRASLARTWLTRPNILLMDEPFGALDSQTRLIIQESFLSVWENKRQPVLLVTHDLEEAVAMADRVVVMSARPGRIKSEYQIDMPRPRSIVALRSDHRFGEYWRQIWSDLEEGARQSLQVSTAT